MEKGFIFDTDRCVGCHACIVACSNQNNTTEGVNWRSVFQYNSFSHPSVPLFFYSLACNHCKDAPCMVNCPANAYYRDPSTNAILIMEDKCLGCKYCSWACPYGAPAYNPFLRIVEKCTLCNDQVEEGDLPACAKCCPTGSLRYDVLDPSLGFDTVKGFSDYGIGPGINFVSPRKKERKPIMARAQKNGLSAEKISKSLPETQSRVSLASEWILVLFTLLVPILIGMFARVALYDTIFPPVLFLSAYCLTFLVSLFHLGRKERFYLAIINLRNSWLSREILLFVLFLGISGFVVLTGIKHLWLILSAMLIGLLTTFCIDMVYRLATRTERRFLHSSQTFLTALLFTAIFLEAVYPMIFVLCLKLLLYLFRKIRYQAKGKNPRLVLSLYRMIFGIILPGTLSLADPLNYWTYILMTIASGELIDRVEFYMELDFVHPEKELYREFIKDLKTAV